MYKRKLWALAVFVPACLAMQAAGAATAPEAQSQGAARFVSGGVGETELQQIKSVMSEYPLELLFVAKGAPNRYMADIGVQIKDRKGQTVLDTRAQGPFLLVKLPAGRYSIVADNDGVKKRQSVKVGARKQRAVFVWSVPVDK